MINKKKIAFFVLEGLDSFIDDIINSLSEKYNTKKIIVKYYNQIDEGMKWADIAWFEWCDPLVVYGSKQKIAKEKKIICRIHSYEVFTKNIFDTNWENIDKVIFVAEHIRDILLKKVKLDIKKTVVIPNGINLKKYFYKEKKSGFNIAFIGYIDFKKGPMLLLNTFKYIYDSDKRYKIYIAGRFNEERYLLYFNQMINEMGLHNNVIFEGWQNNIDKWLDDKNYILCTSVLESQNMSVMQAMSKGIKPIIHNFVGAKNIYPKKYLWNTIDEALNMIKDKEYSSLEYHEFIKNNYDIFNMNKCIFNLLEEFDCKIQGNSKLKNEIEIYKLKINHKDKIEGRLVYKEDDLKSKITVVTPMYNASKFLEGLFKNISEQSIAKSIEWILVDDKSSDNTLKKCLELAKNYKKNFSSIKIFGMEKNSGATSVLSFGFSKASTKYVAWISADDLYISKDKLEKDLTLLSCEKYDMVFSNKMLLGSEVKTAKMFQLDKNSLNLITSKESIKKIAFFIYSNPINGSSLVFNKESYDKIGGFDKFLINVDGDWDIISRAFLCNLKVIYDNKTVFNKVHKMETSKNFEKMLLGTSITRLRVLNVLKDTNNLEEFSNEMKKNNLYSCRTLGVRPIFSYFLLKKYIKNLNEEEESFIKFIEEKYSEEFLNSILLLSQELMKSISYNSFKNKIKNK